jgi:radical SAM protein with 4Fe4S-binding SPASM domain
MKQYRKVQLMDLDLYHKIIDEIALENPEVRVWEIFFGDPFMCFDMASRIRYAKEKGLRDVVLNSNGVRMTKKRAQAVIEAGLDAMYVGIDAATKETYNQIRVGGDFSKAVQNVLQYRDLLQQFGNGAQKLFVQFVVSDINQHEVDDFIDFWKNAGITVKIRPKVSWAGLVEANNLQENENLVRKPCYWMMQTINICADGEVALCSVDVHCQVKCGNVKDHRLKEIWQDRLKTFRALHQAGRFAELPELCKNCRDWQSGYAEFI